MEELYAAILTVGIFGLFGVFAAETARFMEALPSRGSRAGRSRPPDASRLPVSHLSRISGRRFRRESGRPRPG